MKDLYEKVGLFYLGKDIDEDLTLYKSKHLSTHAMLIGMTGSGKTGLGIGLIEEAAIDNIPSIVIDPKGDMGNLCLAFAQLEADEFEPWVENPQDAAKIAKMWKDGLEASGQDKQRVAKFASIAKTIYTPGSSAGVGVNILGSFDAPSRDVLDDKDTLSSLINSTVSSLLSLLSIDTSSINSKEHLLLSNIFYHYYTREINLSLEDLIGLVASPPFEKIGVLTLKSFYPQKERMKLAMALNGIISSVSFSSWIEGEALDIQKMLYDENGKAKISIFSIAHLDDNERMFFVTILLNRYINWMKKQRGTSSLKSILYMDEIFGFFPPSANPPSKKPMLLLLKQARAFGCGVILSTQNPVDLDYKGLSNIGTWFVGKLQTKQDIEKVLEPLSAKSKLSKSEISHRLSTLKGRHFFMKNVHLDETIEFSTRWVLSYLKGPMTKNDIRELMGERKKIQITDKKEVKKNLSVGSKPIISERIKEYFLDTNLNAQTPFYPYLYAKIDLRFYNKKRAIDILTELNLKLELDEFQNILEWENASDEKIDGFTKKTDINAVYSSLPEIIKDSLTLGDAKKSLLNYIYGSKKIELFVCNALKMESELGQSKRDFRVDVETRLKELRDEKIEKIEDKFDVRFHRLEDKLKRLDAKLQKEKSDVSSKTMDTIVDVGIAIFGAFFGKRTGSITSMRRGASAFKKGKRVLKERDDVSYVESLIGDLQEDIQELNSELEDEILKIEDNANIKDCEITSVFIKPRRADIVLKDLALLWER